MPRIKAEHTGKWKISKHEFYTAYHYALQYHEWIDRLKVLTDSVGAVVSDGQPHGSGSGNPTEKLAVQRAEIESKMKTVADTVKEAVEDCPWMEKYLMRAVTDENVTYRYLQMIMEIPCSRDMYYDRRRKFYFLLSKKIC